MLDRIGIILQQYLKEQRALEWRATERIIRVNNLNQYVNESFDLGTSAALITGWIPTNPDIDAPFAVPPNERALNLQFRSKRGGTDGGWFVFWFDASGGDHAVTKNLTTVSIHEGPMYISPVGADWATLGCTGFLVRYLNIEILERETC